MKTRMVILALSVAVVFSCSAVYGATDELMDGMGKKLVRGFVNVLTGWVELPVQIVKGFKSDKYGNKILGTGAGILKGIGHAIGRTAWGAVELVGFWAANPEDNIGIGLPLDDEYAWEEGEPYDCTNPSFAEATLQPMGKKFMRGVGNSLFGFAEFPGQIAKGIGNKSPDLGIIKGLWFWYSRQVYGIADVATTIFPTPEDNPGYSFDQKYPWDALADVIEE